MENFVDLNLQTHGLMQHYAEHPDVNWRALQEEETWNLSTFFFPFSSIMS